MRQFKKQTPLQKYFEGLKLTKPPSGVRTSVYPILWDYKCFATPPKSAHFLTSVDIYWVYWGAPSIPA